MIITVEVTISLEGKPIIGSKSEFDDTYFFSLYDSLNEVTADIRSELIRLGWDAAVTRAEGEWQEA